MLDFSQFTTQDWIAVGSLAVSTLMLVSNIVFGVVSAAKTNRKLTEFERSITRWKSKAEERIVSLEKNRRYVAGVLDGAGLTGGRKRRSARRRSGR